MKGRQVGLVLAAIVLVGVAGLVLRLVSGTPAPPALTGLFPLSEGVVTQVEVRSQGREARLFRVGEEWRVGPHPAYGPRVADLWRAVEMLGSAQTVATSPASHARLGVDADGGVTVSFLKDGTALETVVIGAWSPQAGLAYLRRPPSDTVYALPLDLPSVFNPDPDAWRDPVIVDISAGEVGSLTVSHPEGELRLSREGAGWTLSGGGVDGPADPQAVEGVLRPLRPLLATGFASDDEAEGLDFDEPYSAITLSHPSGGGETRIAFLERDDASFYARVEGRGTVFIVGRSVVEGILGAVDAVLQ